MFTAICRKTFDPHADLRAGFLGLLLCVVPTVSFAEIIWSGDFSTGDFSQYHHSDGPPPISDIRFHHMPDYGMPIDYGWQNPSHIGNGELLSLVAATERTINGVAYPQGPTRGISQYAAKFTVKSSAGGSVDAAGNTGANSGDCDGTNCTRRRTALNMLATHSIYYDALPYLKDRWWSCSIYLPSDFNTREASWGGPSCSIKPYNEASGSGNAAAVSFFARSTWTIYHRWSDVSPLPPLTEMPWQHKMFYTGNYEGKPYPRSDFWAQGLEDYPDPAASLAALQDLNLGGWTDWIVRMRPDARGSQSGGTGFLDIWKRAGDGPWVHVLHVVPKVITRGGITFDRGIGYNVPPMNGNNGGYGMKIQIYGPKELFLGNPQNTVVYFANAKIGDQNATFSDMSPDGSTPESLPIAVRPLPPSFSPGE